jgi:hypothetical protein
MKENKEIYVHEIVFQEKTEFTEKFNRVSELFKKWQETGKEEDFQIFFEEKFKLEQGY